ncbi:MAG: tetratricopeptide repeat protein [Salinarimonas sp.]
MRRAARRPRSLAALWLGLSLASLATHAGAQTLVEEPAPAVDAVASEDQDAREDASENAAPLLSAPAAREPVETSRFRDTTLAAPPPVGDEADPDADLAYGAFQRGYYLTAFHRATQRLERDPDDAAAMTLLGELYSQGLGVPQDVARAADWYRLAARQGDPNALFALAMIAIEGQGDGAGGREAVEADRREGRALLERAAEAGHSRAAYNLALILLGSAEQADIARAAELMRTAAQADVAPAQHALGVLHAQGRGVEEDPIAATAWFARAARNGDVAGMVEYAVALFNGDGIAPDEARAAHWFREAAFRGNAVAQNRLARLHVSGRGVEEDPVEAAAWHLAAAAQGLDDPWLDEALERLGEAERADALALAQERLSAPAAPATP